MGLGDWIMATSQVKRLHAETGRRVLVVDPRGRPRWSEVFENNPRIAREPEPRALRLVNAGGARPYIASRSSVRWTWKRWDIQPGEIFLSAAEVAFGAPYRGMILIEPNSKREGGNKAWLPARWRELVARVDADRCIQTGAPGVAVLPGIRKVDSTFRQALGVLASCAAFVGTEGALHHAAAALGVPAVVLWSEYVAPEFTGYPTQRNLRHAGRACGMMTRCEGCRRSMEAISVTEVHTNLEAILDPAPRHLSA